MTNFSFTRFAYFDTNILSTLAKRQLLWSRLFEFLKDNDLTLGIGGPQIVELSDADRLHRELVDLFINVPSGLLKDWLVIIDEEVKAHPKKRRESLLLYPLNAVLFEENGLNKLEAFLSSEQLRDARNDQLLNAKQMYTNLTRLKPNFPALKSGKYSRKQADEYADLIVLQWLTSQYRDFMASFQSHFEDFHPEAFLSIRLHAYVIFYKYYIGQREPKKLSDFADLGHTFYIPYCDIAVMERDLCNVLTQIKHNHNILQNTEIRNIEFLDNWS